MVEFDSRITKITDYLSPAGDSKRVFECSLTDKIVFNYVPGQFAMIAHPDVTLLANPSQLKWSSYSISSSPMQENVLEFCVGGGSPTGVTAKLKSLSVGDKIKIKGPFGNFKLKENFPSYVLIGMGTGIAPIISMARTLLAKNVSVPISLFFGFRFLNQYMYKEELESLEKKHSNFSVFPVVSRPESETTIRSGHVQDAIDDFSGDVENVLVYICGIPSIAEEIMAHCIQKKGFKKENVYIEKW